MDNSVYYNHELNVYIKVDAVKSMTSTPDGEAWIFEGIASTADADLYNEVVYPESFLNSIDFFKNNGKIFFDHDYAKGNADWLSSHGFSKDEILALRTPIGKPLDAKLTDEGLYIRGVLNKEHPMARLMWHQFLNNDDESFRDQLGLSIGAKYLGQPKKEYDIKKGKYITYLPDLLLYEVSLTPEPVNPHTKSWKAAIKSMLEEAEIPSEKETQYHRIKPDSIQFDASNNQIIVKSTVEDVDGVSHIFEQIIDVKEDVIKSMEDKEMKAMKTVVDSIEASEKDKAEKAMPEKNVMKQAEDNKAGAPMVPQQPTDEGKPMGAPEAAPMPQAEEAPAPQADEAAPEAPAEAVAEEGEGAAEVSEGEAMEEDGASSVLEALAQQSDATDEGQAPAEDDSMSLILDKLDALTDIVSQLMDRMESTSGEEEFPAQAQVTTEVPKLKSFDEETLKSIVQEAVSSALAGKAEDVNIHKSLEISEDSATMLAETIKDVMDSMEEGLVNKAVERVLSETVVTKSVSSEEASSPVVHPGAIADGVEEKDVDVQVMKSVATSQSPEFSPDQMNTLKSMVTEYNSIIGYTSDKSQQRARVIERAQKQLNIHPTIFNVYANKAQRGNF